MENEAKPKVKFSGNTLAQKQKVLETYATLASQLESKVLAVEATAKKLKIPRTRVKHILHGQALLSKSNEIKKAAQANVEKDLYVQVYKDKAPVLENIVQLTLTNIQEFLVALSADEEKKRNLTVRDIKDLATISTHLNEVLRLELGKSTQKVEVAQYSYNKVQVVLDDLRKIDPVFEYPLLQEVNEENSDA